MFIGHYALAFGAKRLAPQTSLGTLITATALLDLIWPVLVLAGIEHVEVEPGITAFTPLNFTSYPYSHSLLMAVVWGALFAGGYMLVKKYPRGALVAGVLVVSHWLLDAITHRPDLQLAPGNDFMVGFGLWNSVPGTLIVELLMFAGGLWLYIRAKPIAGAKWALPAFVGLILVTYVSAAFGPPPPNAQAVAIVDLTQWLVVGLAAWIDAKRS